jgi:hypothetical protein
MEPSHNATPKDSKMTIRLHIIDRDGFTKGYTDCVIGLQTTYGKVTRFTDKTVWTESKSGSELKHRACDGRLPSVYQSKAPRRAA